MIEVEAPAGCAPPCRSKRVRRAAPRAGRAWWIADRPVVGSALQHAQRGDPSRSGSRPRGSRPQGGEDRHQQRRVVLVATGVVAEEPQRRRGHRNLDRAASQADQRERHERERQRRCRTVTVVPAREPLVRCSIASEHLLIASAGRTPLAWSGPMRSERRRTSCPRRRQRRPSLARWLAEHHERRRLDCSAPQREDPERHSRQPRRGSISHEPGRAPSAGLVDRAGARSLHASDAGPASAARRPARRVASVLAGVGTSRYHGTERPTRMDTT